MINIFFPVARFVTGVRRRRWDRCQNIANIDMMAKLAIQELQHQKTSEHAFPPQTLGTRGLVNGSMLHFKGSSKQVRSCMVHADLVRKIWAENVMGPSMSRWGDDLAVPREMSAGDIRDGANRFTDSEKIVAELSVNNIEIYGTHRYCLSLFMSLL